MLSTDFTIARKWGPASVRVNEGNFSYGKGIEN